MHHDPGSGAEEGAAQHHSLQGMENENNNLVLWSSLFESCLIFPGTVSETLVGLQCWIWINWRTSILLVYVSCAIWNLMVWVSSGPKTNKRAELICRVVRGEGNGPIFMQSAALQSAAVRPQAHTCTWPHCSAALHKSTIVMCIVPWV